MSFHWVLFFVLGAQQQPVAAFSSQELCQSVAANVRFEGPPEQPKPQAVCRHVSKA